MPDEPEPRQDSEAAHQDQPPLHRLLNHRAFPLVAFSALSLGLGYWLKARCLHLPWSGGTEFRHYCYNDLYPLYWANGYADGLIPYVEVQSEYPVITGAIPWLLTFIAGTIEPWWHANAILLLAAGLVVTAVLVAMGYTWRRAIPWILAPSIVTNGFTNWDLWGVALMVVGLWRFKHGRILEAGLWLGLGAAAKLFPIILVPGLAVVLVNRKRNKGRDWRSWETYRQSGRLVAGFLLGVVPPNLVFAVQNPDLWLRTYTFHSERGTTFQTIYWLLDQRVMIPYFDHPMTITEFNVLSLLLFLTTSGALLLYALHRRTDDAFLLSMGLMATYLLTNKVYSPQYTLWLLPLFVLSQLPLWSFWAYQTSELVAFNWAYHFRTPPPGQTQGFSVDFYAPYQLASLAQLATLALVVVLVWRALQNRRNDA